jgi:hypothetical protein
MSVDPELLAAYPGCPHALGWGEASDPRVAEATWAEARRKGLSPAQTVEQCKVAARIVIDVLRRLPGVPAAARTMAAEILAEMDHPDFLRYVRGKLGAI